ncbi:MAG: methyltransferase family protein [Phenylobacterium sp.]
MSGGRLIALLLAEFAALMAVMGGLLFGAAGTTDWPSAWAYLGLFLTVGLAVSLWLFAIDPGLLAERLKPPVQRGQKGWDRLFLLAVMVAYMGWHLLMAADARRFGWSDVPLGLQVLGAALIVASYLGIAWVYRANSFAAPVIKIQADRGQTVIDTGPYAIVRHPMYAFAVLQFVGAPLMLGSWWGLAVVPPMVLGVAWRALGEERMLRDELAGYDDYARRVRWRFAPGLW